MRIPFPSVLLKLHTLFVKRFQSFEILAWKPFIYLDLIFEILDSDLVIFDDLF